MAKEKRKNRLDKGTGSSEFIGFSAFAESSPSRSSREDVDETATATKQSSSLQWAPVYTGSDSELHLLFPRISQKRDATTKVKAIQDLATYLNDAERPRKLRVEALLHWAWLYHHKVHYDVSASVRAAALSVWRIAAEQLPKAARTIMLQYPELAGMLYSARVDPAAEVRLQATDNTQPVFCEQASDWPWQQGVFDYVNRILSYGRASVMHEALFKKKNESASELNEAQRDALEERFERLVGTALQTMEVWLRENKEVTVSCDSSSQQQWWKTLKSPKASLRRKTYQLVATTTSLQGQLLPDDMDTMLVQALASEKEAANIPTLLETILTFYAQDRSRDPTLLFQKPLAKLFKKACYGARVSEWGPTLLPLTALFSRPVVLLQALWEGRDLTFGDSDRWNLLSALVEGTSFSLLKKQQQDGGDDAASSTADDDAQELARLWLQTLQAALTTNPSTLSGLTLTSYMQLLQEIAKYLVQFEEATTQQRKCDFLVIHTWFWDTALTFCGSDPIALAKLIEEIRARAQKNASEPSPLVPRLREFFLEDLSQYQASSGSVPSGGSYRLFEELFAYCGPLNLLESGSLEKFVMNDLLRWIIIHTSTLSTQLQSQCLVQQDFGLLSSCMSALREKRPVLWESLLREIIAAKCELDWLVEGILVLCKDDEDASWLSCPTLDQFASDVGILRYQASSSNVTAEESANGPAEATVQEIDYKRSERLTFLRLCLGLTDGSSAVLVSRGILTGWIEHECVSLDQSKLSIRSKSSALLEALLELVQKKRSLISPDEVDRIFLTAWQQGGRLFSDAAVQTLSEELDLCRRFISRSSKLLREQLDLLCTSSNDCSISATARRWSERAWRLIQVSQSLSYQFPGEEDLSPSFALVGLADVNGWRQHSETMYLCSTSLFQHIEVASDRLALVLASKEDSTDLLISILLSISEASSDAAKAARVKFRRDCCAKFLLSVGGKAMSRELLEGLINSIVTIVSGALEENNDEETRKSVAVLSQLLEILLKPLALPEDEILVATDIVEGSQLWYISDPTKPNTRELAEVSKVHYDAQAGYYFSIRVKRNGESQERQTVLERLRRDGVVDSSLERISPETISDEERTQRASICNRILNELIRPRLSSAAWSSTVAELVNVVCCQVGLGPERGLGSANYELFRAVAAIEEQSRDALTNGDMQVASDSLWSLSLALGYGLNVPTFGSVFKELPIDPKLSVEAILDCYQRVQIGANPSLDCAILVWLSTSLVSMLEKGRSCDESSEEPSLLDGTMSLLFRVSSHLLDSKEKNGFCATGMIASRAVYEGLKLMAMPSQTSVGFTEEAKEATAQLVKSFASSWEDEASTDAFGLPGPDWLSFSSFTEVMRLGRTNSAIRELLTLASGSSNAEALSDALFVVSKRHFALQLLNYCALTGDASFNQVPLSRGTSRRLQTWTEGFEDEEAEEVSDDIEIVSRWLPRRMMNEIEQWGEEVYEETDDVTTVGRLLTWLCVLRFVDVVSPKDFRYRPAFVSYLGQCGAANAALNIALLNDESINDPKGKTAPALLDVEGLLHDKSLLQLPKLSSLVLFQTVEILPSLSRRWWEESCPKVYVNDVQSFVEKYVAPEILSRELSRIRSATSRFGDMVVSASSVSREVTATYTQDDFKLSVLILLPSAFPFRSAQVDCSKTLGVPKDRWKRWSLQITLMLNNQGGTLQDALMLWKDNVDKEFEGVEPCPVCYSVLHVKTHKLPSLECTTCHNRFHFDCLTQWFRSSGKSQCVLCQQPWHGTRIL